MTEIVQLLKDAGLTWLIWFVVIVFVGGAILERLADASERVEKALGWYGRVIARRREKRQNDADVIAELRSENTDLKRQVAEKQNQASAVVVNLLSRQLGHFAYQLRLAHWRNEMTDAYLIEDAKFHRDVALAGTTGLPGHTPYPEFEESWTKQHPLPQQRFTDALVEWDV